MRTLLLLLALVASQPRSASLHGRVVMSDGTPVPGCTTTLTAGSEERTAITDGSGKYKFEGVSPDRYTLTFALSGLGSTTREVALNRGANEEPDTELPFVITEGVTLACGLGARNCEDEAPKRRTDLPVCEEFNFHTSLIERVKAGDHSAIEQLERQRESTISLVERLRIDRELLGRVRDDQVIWKELSALAEQAVRYPSTEEGEIHPDLTAYCERNDLDPGEYWWMTLQSLEAIAKDRRGRPLLERALWSSDPHVVRSAIYAFAGNDVEEAISLIDAAIARFPDDDEDDFIFALALFKNDSADFVALKYLPSEDARRDYFEFRNEVTEPTSAEPSAP